MERRAATIVPGSSALAKTSVKWPSSRRSTASTEAGKSPAVGPWWYCQGDQMHGDLGVGVAGELHARGFQFGAQRGEVLDDAVVDDGDLPGGVAVRVGVAVGRPAVGGPAGVPEAGAAREGGGVGLGQRGLEIGEPPGPARTVRPPWPSSRATPDESYPRYSIRRSASTTMSQAGRCPT